MNSALNLNMLRRLADPRSFDRGEQYFNHGKDYKANVKSQEGSGHHRSAVVEFNNPKAKEVEILIKDVGGIKERIFKF